MSDASRLPTDDELAPMRGVVCGVLFSLLIWAVVIIPTAAIGYGVAWAVTK